jgi:hypothetical protein
MNNILLMQKYIYTLKDHLKNRMIHFYFIFAKVHLKSFDQQSTYEFMF